MRTDVKVGLVCILALVVAVITYFAIEGKKDQPAVVKTNTETVDTGKVTTPASTPVDIAPPPMVTPPAAYTHTPVAQIPSTYSPPASTMPSSDGSLIPGSGAHPLLPPMPGTPGTPGTPSLSTDPPLVPSSLTGGTGSLDRPGDPEPSNHRDPLLQPLPGHGAIAPPLTHTPSNPIVPAGGEGTYIVQNGDNLTTIAKKNHTTVAALKAANPTINPDRLKIKQVITLPAPGTDVPTTRPVTTRPSRSSTRPAATHGAASTRPAHSGGSAPLAGGTYTVKKGDTLRKIAKAVYGDEKLWRRIFRVNRGELANANDITPGMVLKIPAK